jgi:cation transport ATPase
LDFHSNSNQQLEKVDDEEYKERDYATRHKAEEEEEEEPEERGFKQWIMGWKKKKVDEDGEARVDSLSRSRSSNKKKKGGMFSLKLVFKIFVVAAVCYNFNFIWNFMKDPMGNFTFYHTLFVLGICAGINFIAVWILFYKSSFMRFYLSLFAILGSFGYYFYVNYTNHSFVGNNIKTSLLVMISVLIVINPKVNYYLKSILLLLIPIIGIYLSGNKFALVWALMLSAGFVLLFRVSKSRGKSKSNKKESRARRNQKQSA